MLLRVAPSFRTFGLQRTVLRASGSAVLKQNPEVYFNWIASNYNLKGVAESITHPNNVSLLTPEHYEMALYRMQKAGQWERMEPILEFVRKETPFSPTEKMQGFLLMAYLKKGEYDSIISSFESFKEEREMTKISWNIYLSALGKRGEISKLRDAFDNLSSLGFTPDEYSYHALIEGYMISRQYKQALETLDTMKANNVQPTSQTYTILVHWYAQYNNIPEAISMIKKMKKDGLDPTVYTHTALIHGMCANKKQLEGFEWLKQLYKDGFQPNIRAYTSLAKTFNETRQYGYVIRLWKMLQNDENIEISTMNKNFFTKIIKKAGTSLSDTGKE